MSSIKQEQTLTASQENQACRPERDPDPSEVNPAPMASGKKRRRKHQTQEVARKSTRQRHIPKQYEQEENVHKSETGRAQWNEEELGRLLNCLQKYQRPDKVRSVKKHVKTRNLEQVEAKIQYLRKKALDRAWEETVSMPPLQCWENLAKDVTSTLSDESYKEISKVFWTATAEPLHGSAKSSRNPDQPNYNEIYKFLAALLRGTEPNELSPIDAMIVLECLNNTVEFLQKTEMKEHKSYLQTIYKDLFYKLYTSDKEQTQTDEAGTMGECSSPKPPGSDSPSTSGGASTSGRASKKESAISGIKTLNPFDIPVNKLNLIWPHPCSEHGNLYCWISTCREGPKTQQAS